MRRLFGFLLLLVGFNVMASDNCEESAEDHERLPAEAPECTREFDAEMERTLIFLSLVKIGRYTEPYILTKELNRIYKDYYLSTSFKQKGGSDALADLAEAHDVELEFSCADLPNAIFKALHDPKVQSMGAIAVLGTLGGTIIIVPFLGSHQPIGLAVVGGVMVSIAIGGCCYTAIKKKFDRLADSSDSSSDDESSFQAS